MTEQNKAKVIKADYGLQSRVGTGPLDKQKVEECERVIEHNNIDFAPMANEFLRKLNDAIEKAQSGELGMGDAKQAITQPVMELKANASVFKYNLIGNLANVMLSFLEAVNEFDKNVVEIVDAHHKTLSIIISQKMKGDGGQHGKLFEQELRDACKRYFTKKREAAAEAAAAKAKG